MPKPSTFLAENGRNSNPPPLPADAAPAAPEQSTPPSAPAPTPATA